MKTIKQFFTLLLVAVPVLAFGQISDKDSVFLLDRKLLEMRKAITGKSKNELTGFTWGVKAGYFSQSGNSEYSNNPAAVASLSLEFGYRVHFLEVGFRHIRTGFAFGADYPFFYGFTSPTRIARYGLPVLSGLASNMATAKFHIPIKKVALFIDFGAGNSIFKFSDKFIYQDYYPDGTFAYVHTPSTFPILQKIKAFTVVYGLGFSKGPFTAGLEWYQLREGKGSSGRKYSNNFQNMYVGVQMNTSQKRNKKPEIFSRKRVALGVSKLVMKSPFNKNAGTSTGWTVDASVNLGKRMSIQGSYQFNAVGQGYTKLIPVNSADIFKHMPDPAGHVGRHLLYAGTSLTPRNAFQMYVYGGAGYYFSTSENSAVVFDTGASFDNFEFFGTTGGVVVGTGFQYKYIHSQVLLHKTFISKHMILEWNLGGRMLF